MRAKHVGFSEVATVQRFSFRKYPKKCTDLDLILFYILILGTHSKFARKNIFLALGVCFLQPCSSAGRRFAAIGSRLHYYTTNCFASTKMNSMKCLVNWIPLRIRVRSKITPPTWRVRRLWLLTSDRLETWLIPSGTTWFRRQPEQVDWKNPPTPRGVSYFIMFPHQESWVRGSPSKHLVFFEGVPLTHGSGWGPGNILNRKPPRGGGVLSIKVLCTRSKEVLIWRLIPTFITQDLVNFVFEGFTGRSSFNICCSSWWG